MAALLRLSVLQPFHRLFVPAKTLLSRTRPKFDIQLKNVTQNVKLPWEVDTKVAKDIVLYNYENRRFHKMLHLFSVTQYLFWIYLAHFSHSTLRDVPVKTEDESAPWYRKINLGENKYRNGITFMCFCVGTGVLVCSWMFAMRSVQTVVLRKGGKDVTFVTNGPLNRLRYVDVPLSKVSACQTRTDAKVNLPIKIKGWMGYFLIDMRGQFHKPVIFDATVGLNRILK